MQQVEPPSRPSREKPATLRTVVIVIVMLIIMLGIGYLLGGLEVLR
jgi:hypothetical protein